MSSNPKKSAILLAYLSMVIGLLTISACGGAALAVKPPQKTLPPRILTTHEAVASKKLAPSAHHSGTTGPVGTRRNPAPFGTGFTIDKMTLKVTGLIRPADDLAAKGNMFNTVPQAGKEYVFVNLSAACNRSAGENCNLNDFDFKMVGSSGQTHDEEMFLTGVSGMIKDGDFPGGATKSGYIAFIVDKSETNLLLIYAPFLSNVAYLSAGQ